MIELLRYARMKPYGVVSTEVKGETVVVSFKRFSVSLPNTEETPEVSEVLFSDLEQKLADLQIELGAVKELLALKPQ